MQPLQWATDVVNLMAQRVDQVLKLSKEAAQGLSESSQLMLNTCKIMQAVIGEQAAVMQQLAEATSSIENAANALVNLYQDYQALMDQMLTQQEQQNQ
jgi:methyl-accepting chemotaxis protein